MSEIQTIIEGLKQEIVRQGHEMKDEIKMDDTRFIEFWTNRGKGYILRLMKIEQTHDIHDF